MKVLIWGIPCVGKSEVGELLAKKLNYKFFNMNDLIKQKYKTIDDFHEKFANDYDRFKEKERIALDIINNNDDFVLTITLIYIEEIVKNITNTDTISVELVDSIESIYDRLLFYDENDEVMSDSKEYRDAHKNYYINEIRNDKRTSYNEYKDIPKFNLNDRKFEDIIDELSDYVFEISRERNKINMIDIETKKLTNYDMKRILSRVEKDFGKIERGTEEYYNPQLDYIEHAIYDLQKVIPISDYELQEIIPAIVYDLKGYVDNKIYDYSEILDEKLVKFAKELEYLFNPFINEEIKINEMARNDLKGLFTLPIICLNRIYDSIDFWRHLYGKDGYFRMLEEMVVPIKQIGEFPYALEEKYLIK